MAWRNVVPVPSVPNLHHAETLGVVLVQPATWSPDGRTNIRRAADDLRELGSLGERSIVVLPELIGSNLGDDAYIQELRSISEITGAWLVGGSHHGSAPTMNAGAVLEPDGKVVDRYQKRFPYGIEHEHGVQAGDRTATCRVAGRDVTVMVCADAWFAELLVAHTSSTDLVVVPSFSITRRPPQFARALWRHLAVARAYEFTAFVALADWQEGAAYGGTPCAGTSGIADPLPSEPAGYFVPAAHNSVSIHRLDFAKLELLRADRLARRFARHLQLNEPDGQPRS